MSITTHLEALNSKHAQLEKQLHYAVMHHLSTADIKKEKLRVKDEIVRSEKMLQEESHFYKQYEAA